MRTDLNTIYNPRTESGYTTKIKAPLKNIEPEIKEPETVKDAIEHPDGKGLFVDASL